MEKVIKTYYGFKKTFVVTCILCSPLVRSASQVNNHDLSTMARPLEKLQSQDDLVIKASLFKVKYIDPSQETKTNTFIYKYEGQVFINFKEERIGLLIKDTSDLDKLFENQSPQLRDMGINYYLRGDLYQVKNVSTTEWRPWMMKVNEVQKWEYKDPCAEYKSIYDFKNNARGLPSEILANPIISKSIKLICSKSNKLWLYSNAVNMSKKTFIVGCDKDTDYEPEGYAVFVDGKLIVQNKSTSINRVLDKQYPQLECDRIKYDKYFESFIKN